MGDQKAIIAMSDQYIMRTYGRLPIALVRGQGLYVWDADGKRYLDFVSGLAVDSLGHCHPRVVAAIQNQAAQFMHCSNLYHIEPQARLAKLLVENSVLDRVFFCNSGAEAIEAAIKLARKYAKKKHGPERYEIISAYNSFHGRTLAAITATGQAKFQQGLEPLPDGFKYAIFNDLESLKSVIGPHTAAVLLEPIQGEGGVNVADGKYLEGVRRLCDEHGLLLILDEVQCGLGRTGRLFAYEHYGITPDIMALAKALGGGFPIGAMLATEEAASGFAPGDHASTFGGNPLACAAGLAAVQTIIETKLVEHSAKVGDYFLGRLRGLQDRYPFVKEVRGKGLLLGMELSIKAGGVVTRCREQGLLINCIGDHTLRFIPPLIVTGADVDAALKIVRAALDQEGEG
ncbi:MAG: acetylornithine transaminase [Eubacteriales bacterium]|nr:acetylornithine transaminase [Bacillota bacterium]MBV1728226.1 acetylornithine transaminase [Desulforudis sp.]MDP3049811.1 acetylornithine transaminase [Eubacteriales bacterium]MDQ7789277.1 acetylornithine transaminase [Clostridia bacterium]MBU4532376.1 acetylornithine transaminase [Bacillota bacterium]